MGDTLPFSLLPVAAGDGYIPVGALVERLLQNGYDGYFAIEHFDAPNQRESILRSAAFLRRAAEGAGGEAERKGEICTNVFFRSSAARCVEPLTAK